MMNHIHIKVCGMKDLQNIEELSTLPIDMMGMIFYPKSPRYLDSSNIGIIPTCEQKIKRVGVFVDEKFEVVLNHINDYKLDLVQLHGKESYEYCLQFATIIPIIKTFSIANASDIEIVNNFGNFNGYYLFDTKTPQHGGSGNKFDWSVLDYYNGDMPFFLSGGIAPEDADLIKQIKHPLFYGIDLNSRFEIEPGFKNIMLLRKFINNLRT